MGPRRLPHRRDLDPGIAQAPQGPADPGSDQDQAIQEKAQALPIAIDALKAHKDRQETERGEAGEHWTETGYVFTTSTGSPIDPANLRRAFRALLHSAGISAKHPTMECPKPGQWHPHEMRHSAGSYMDHMGIPHEQIAEILGHKGTRTTEEVYIHNQEIIDMTADSFRTYGNQFGNQDPEEAA